MLQNDGHTLIDPLVKVETVLGQKVKTRCFGHEAAALGCVSCCGCRVDVEVEGLGDISIVGVVKGESADTDLNSHKLSSSLSKFLVALLKRNAHVSASPRSCVQAYFIFEVKAS